MLSNRDVKKVEDPINILEAAVAHLHCRTKLKQFMRGELLDSNALNVDLDVQCKLGRWLQRNDILPAEHLPLLARVKENHTEFHRYADTIFNKINNGEVQEA